MMRSARVVAVTSLSPRFRLIELEGDDLKGVTWAQGQKVQLAVGRGLASRTYTPMAWDADVGRTRLLAFVHGDGPGSHWASGLRSGESCQFLGPRRSLDLADPDTPVALFGDETSFGMAATLGGDAISVFEASDIAESRVVLAAIGLGRAMVIERCAGDGHLAEIGSVLTRHAASGEQLVLTGRAPSIQRVSQDLKQGGLASSRIKAKAYWAPGKAGLD
ncbi:FAD-binding protein [Gluconobacter thailandicus]|nr:FAD-binding protein [Gluconobacter thailandicus]